MFKSLLTAMIATAMLAGCANQRFNVAGDITGSTPKMEDSQSFWVSGIGQQSNVDAAQVCGGAAKVVGADVEQTGVNVLVGLVTFGIYTPRTARVYCK
jgi:hypothetical protein